MTASRAWDLNITYTSTYRFFSTLSELTQTLVPGAPLKRSDLVGQYCAFHCTRDDKSVPVRVIDHYPRGVFGTRRVSRRTTIPF